MKYILSSLLVFSTCILYAQHKEEAEKLVSIGVPYHDKGDYEGAIARYDSALALDKDNLLALAEKAYTLMAMEKYEESIECCKRAIKTHPGDEGLKMLYVTYGTDYDYEKKRINPSKPTRKELSFSLIFICFISIKAYRW